MPKNIRRHPKFHHTKVIIITIKNSTPDIFPVNGYMGKKIDILSDGKAHIYYLDITFKKLK